MLNIKKVALLFVAALAVTFGLAANADVPQKRADGVTVIHLDQYGGYFDAEETLSGLKAGTYEFVITNKTNKVVGFQIQNYKTHAQLDMFPLEPNETKTSRVKISTDGARFRCPINPTPWYDLDNVKAK